MQASIALAWRQRWRLLIIQTVFMIASWGLLSPLAGTAVHAAVLLSGRPALTDVDIARFLLSPIGFLAGLVAASALIVIGVQQIAVIMAISHIERRSHHENLLGGVNFTFRRAPRLMVFAVLLLLRLLAICLPSLALAWWIVAPLLAAADINYYLAHQPPEAVRSALWLGLLALAVTSVLLNRLAAWLLAPALVLFGDIRPHHAFAQSAERTSGARLTLTLSLLLAGLAALAIGALIFILASETVRLAVVLAGTNLGAISIAVLTGSAVWLLASTAAGAALSGVLAAFMTRALLESETDAVSEAIAETSRPKALRSGRAWVAILLVLVAAAGATVSGLALFDATTHHDKVVVIGHRGAAGARPENTLAAFEQAILEGADWIEIDVQETADGEVVVIHDKDFMKLAGVPLQVHEAVMADIAKIDIGSWFSPAFADQRTPTLRETLEYARGRIKVLIELKHYGHAKQLEARVAEIVETARMVDQVAIMSLDPTSVARMKTLRPTLRVGLLAAVAAGDMAALDADFMAVRGALASTSFIRRARQVDKQVLVWTVNDPLSMSAMISRGVDGLITDEPGIARQVLAERAKMGASERLLLVAADLIGLPVVTKRYRDDSP